MDVLILSSGMPSKSSFHVRQRIDRDAALADFAFRHRMIGVVAHQRRQMKGDGQSGLAVFQQIVEALVRFLGGAESAELPHRPELAAVHRFVDAARIGRLAGIAKIAGMFKFRDALGVYTSSTGTPDIVVNTRSRTSLAMR